MEKKIEALIDIAFKELGYDDCFLVDLKVNNTKVEVFIDSDTSVTYLICRKISRIIEAVLDEKQWLGEKYTLNVCSAGIGSALKFPRQYKKNVGRSIVVKTEGGEKVKGELSAADDNMISVKYTEVIKEGKKKKKIEIVKDVLLKDIKEAKIKVSF
ncbi:MAG: ribosome maturation factor [Saprospiraceae bacterium]